MKLNKWLLISTVILCLTIGLCTYYISKQISNMEILYEANKVVDEVENSNDILSLSEAAKYLEISKHKLEWLIKNSKYTDGEGIPYYKIDDKIMFSKIALSKWIVHISENNFEY